MVCLHPRKIQELSNDELIEVYLWAFDEWYYSDRLPEIECLGRRLNDIEQELNNRALKFKLENELVGYEFVH